MAAAKVPPQSKDDTKKIRLLNRIEDLNPRKTLKMKATTGLQLDLIYLKNISGRFIGNLFYECTIIIQDGFADPVLSLSQLITTGLIP